MAGEERPVALDLLRTLALLDHAVRARVTKVLPRGMELSHLLVLDHLSMARRENTPAELAAALRVTRGAMTNTLARLEAAGHVHIRPDWEDARQKRVAISPAGQLARDQAAAELGTRFPARPSGGRDLPGHHAALEMLRQVLAAVERDAG